MVARPPDIPTSVRASEIRRSEVSPGQAVGALLVVLGWGGLGTGTVLTKISYERASAS
jgi:hypothetical protein